MAKPDNVRFSIQLPAWYDRRLRLWAVVKGTNRATLASNILQARIEANWSEVEKQMEEIAAMQQMSVDELITLWLDE